MVGNLQTMENYCFVVDSSRLHLIFKTFGRLFVIRKQYNYYVDQS